MKLEDIDKMVQYRAEYRERKLDYDAAAANDVCKVVHIGDRYIKDYATMKLLATTLRERTKTLLDEAKTRLMMLGIDEFPE